MIDTSGVTPQDLTFHISDQSGPSQPQLHPNGHYNERSTNTPGPHEVSMQAPAQDPTLVYPNSNAKVQQIVPEQFNGFAFVPSSPLGWNWSSAIDLADFTSQYELQGELAQEMQIANFPANDFTIGLTAQPQEAVNSTTLESRSENPTPPGAQNPPSPPSRLQPQRPAIHIGMKRRIDSELHLAVSQTASIRAEHMSKRHNNSRKSSDASLASPVIATGSEGCRPSITQVTNASIAAESPTQTTTQGSITLERHKSQSNKGTGPQGRTIDVSKSRKMVDVSGTANILPAGKVFPIQIGSELFRLSGASISSDAPSYFSHFFGEQLHNNGGRASEVRTLYIDRDPKTFRDIALHLQGYHVVPRDGEHYVKLFADAQFYSLPRLTKQLFSNDIFIRIGGTPFQIPRDLFSAPGDSPNYFTLGFAQFFSTPSKVFPGLDQNMLLRPPTIPSPSVPNRSGETFKELVQLLQGYNLEIRDDTHRSRLLRDARYFHLKGLEQRLIPCEVSYNLKRQSSEILIRLDDIRQSGVSFKSDKPPLARRNTGSSAQSVPASPATLLNGKHASVAPSLADTSAVQRGGYVCYARPYTDDHANVNNIILEVSTTESMTIRFSSVAPKYVVGGPIEVHARATFYAGTLARITSLFSVIASKMGLPATQPLGLMYLQSGGGGLAAQPISPANSGVSERRVRIRIDNECAIMADGEPVEIALDESSGRIGIKSISNSEINNRWLWGVGNTAPDASTLKAEEEESDVEWTAKRSQWRIRVEPFESEGDMKKTQVVLCGVKIEAYTVERTRNKQRDFLGRN